MRLALVALLAVLAIPSTQARLPGPPPPPPDSITDIDAYAIYTALLLPSMSKGTLLVQQETEPWTRTECRQPLDAEWEAVESNFYQENARVRLLKPLLATDRPYRFTSRTAIKADDARLELKYPGIWQRRPESIEFAAVSAVGFDWSRTKAMVAVNFRNRGNLVTMELRDGVWVTAPVGCGWIA